MQTDPRHSGKEMIENKKAKRWINRDRRGEPGAREAIERLAKAENVSEMFAGLLYNRGYETPESAKDFLRLEETVLHDPFEMRDMKKAVERIRAGIERKEKIAIYGDYDVDGVTSVSLLYLYLTSRGADVGYYIPSRAREGYGLSELAIDTLAAKKVQLMITVDTGITAIKEVAYAGERGIETVVTDHHECRADLPDACAVVNPHRQDDVYPFKELAGVGVIFKVITAMEIEDCRRNGRSVEEGIRRICNTYADLVAIGTIADVMPIVNENRLIVKVGLGMLENTRRPGLRALIEAASGGTTGKKRKINSGFVGFALAPRMNAAGRVASASIAVELLLAEDAETAKKYADQLCELNATRQVEENRIAEQAYRMIDSTYDPQKDRVLVLSDDSWQQGIIGIVSSRITERYGLPSILISFDGSTRGYPDADDLGKGSGRSIKGLNLVEALADSESLLARFGGHELAAGLSVRRSNIDAFRERINRYAAEHLSEDDLCASVEADCEVSMRELTMDLANEIERLEPFGVENPIPNFILTNARVQKIIPLAGGKHTRLTLEKDGEAITAVWFGMPSSRLSFEVGDPVDVLFQLNINEYQNVYSLQMIVQDMRVTPSFLDRIDAMKKRYEEIRAGAEFSAEEEIIPSREEIGVVYTLLRREYRAGRSVFPIRKLLLMTQDNGGEAVGYAKLKIILRVLQELQICGVEEPEEDQYIFSFSFQPTKTSIEKSSILRRLKSQQRNERVR